MDMETGYGIRKLCPIQVKTLDLQSLWRWGTLTQYYDPLLRCFTFKDFQLALTLEEYERIIGLPLAKSPPYLFGGQYPSWALVAKLLKTSKREPGTTLREFREPTLKTDSINSSRKVTILFPHVEDYIDLADLDTFLAKKDRGENLVIVVLANTYYTLNYCHEKHGTGLRCCTSLLYLWITAYLFQTKRRATCPIKDHH
ncbi:hypothetical protein CR513_11815, partial [Mucuna pruriens]